MLIGFVGKKGSGKDTIALFLESKKRFTKYAFAEPLKKACKELFLLNDNQLYDPNEKETVDLYWNITPRVMLQMIGTDFIRKQFDANFWIKHFVRWFHINKAQNIVVTDCRFQNEIDIIKELGGIVIKIERKTSIFDDHISEAGIDNLTNIDFIIENNSTKDECYNELINALNSLNR